MTPGTGEPLTFLEELIRRPAWQRYGSCRGEGVEAFVPSVGGNFTRARELCGGCTVRAECLDFALADEDLHRHVGRDDGTGTTTDEDE